MNLYLTNQLTVEATTTRSSNRVVMFIVKVKLVDRNEKSHVGSVYVTNVIVQYSTLGTTVNMPKARPPSILKVDRAESGVPAGMLTTTLLLGARELTEAASCCVAADSEADTDGVWLPSMADVDARGPGMCSDESDTPHWEGRCGSAHVKANQTRNVHFRVGELSTGSSSCGTCDADDVSALVS